MLIQKKCRLVSVLAVCLMISLLLSSASFAAEIKASRYLDNYEIGCTAMGNGKVKIWGRVYANRVMDEIGVAVVDIYEGTDPEGDVWTHQYSSYYNLESTMAGTNCSLFEGYTNHYGTTGKYYKAYVTVFVEYNGVTEARSAWTLPVRAT